MIEKMETNEICTDNVSDYFTYIKRNYLGGSLNLPMMDIQKFIQLVKNEKNVVKKTILFYMLLFINYNKENKSQKKNSKLNSIEIDDNENVKRIKIDKKSSIPSWYNDKSIPSLLALWIFRMSEFKNYDIIKYGIFQIYKVKSSEWNSVEKIVNINKNDLPDDLKISCDDSFNSVVKILMKLSEFCKDSQLSKLVYAIDKNCYKKACNEIEENWDNSFKTIYPFYPLREEVIKNSIGKIEQSTERETLTKQFQCNPKEVISQLVKKLDLIENQTKIIKKKDKSKLFKEDVVYEYYQHDKKYYEDIKQLPIVLNGITYYIQTLKKCLFDVTSKTENGVDHIFSNMSWSERIDKYKNIIDLVPVPLKTDTGENLNKITDSCHFTVEYKTEEGYIRKNITIAKRTNNKKTDKNE